MGGLFKKFYLLVLKDVFKVLFFFGNKFVFFYVFEFLEVSNLKDIIFIVVGEDVVFCVGNWVVEVVYDCFCVEVKFYFIDLFFIVILVLNFYFLI